MYVMSSTSLLNKYMPLDKYIIDNIKYSLYIINRFELRECMLFIFHYTD